MLIVYIVQTLYDMVYCSVHVDCVQDVTNIVTWSTAVSMLIVYRMLQTLYDMVYCDVHVDCVYDKMLDVNIVYCGDMVQDVTTAVSMLIVYKMLLTLYDMVAVTC